MNNHATVDGRDGGTRSPATEQQTLYRGFIHSHDAERDEVTLVIDGIHCSSCSKAIEKSLTEVAGVLDIHVNPSTRHGSLSWNPAEVSLDMLLERIVDLGFRPRPVRVDNYSAGDKTEFHKSLKRLIIAGLGMMQVMTYAIALYTGAFTDMPTVHQQFFRLLSLLVATPVVFYSAAPFFRAALSDMKQNRVGMDVPVALAIGIAYGASVGITFFGNLHTHVYFDSAVMFTFFLSFGRLVEMRARHKTVAVSEALSSSMPANAIRLDTDPGGGWLESNITLKQVQVGDRILVSPGEVIAADGEVIWGESSTDNSLITGESLPVACRVGDKVVGGSLNVSGPVHVMVTHIGPDTELSGIARLLERAQAQRPRMAQLADHIASYFVAAVLMIALVVGVAWLAIDPSKALSVSLAILVVTCPCALSLATPAALSTATGFLARNGLLVTRGSALETLAKVDCVLFDKTGTLTKGRLNLVNVRLMDTALNRVDCTAIAAALESGSSHPVAAALGKQTAGIAAHCLEVVPGQGIEGIVDNICYRIGSLTFVSNLSARSSDCVQKNDVTTVYLGDANSIIAAFELRDVLRPDATQTVHDFRALGIKTAILSGDAIEPVKHVAHALGIEDYEAALLPEQKLASMQRRRSQGQVIAMVGDGINDAPVLAGADISFAMGTGSMLAQSGADIILLGNGLSKLLTGITQSRLAMRIIRQNMMWAILYNVIALPLAATGLIAPWIAAIGMSTSSLVVVLNALRLGRAGSRRPTTLPTQTLQSRPAA